LNAYRGLDGTINMNACPSINAPGKKE